jgi:hypothetical protein
VQQVDADARLEQLAGEMIGRARPGRCECQLSGVLLRQRDELGEAFRRHEALPVMIADVICGATSMRRQIRRVEPIIVASMEIR